MVNAQVFDKHVLLLRSTSNSSQQLRCGRSINAIHQRPIDMGTQRGCCADSVVDRGVKKRHIKCGGSFKVDTAAIVTPCRCQLGGGAGGNNGALIHDVDMVGQSLGFVNEVSGQHHTDTVVSEGAHKIPHHVA